MAIGGETQPQLVKGDGLNVHAELTELVEVAVALATPVLEVDAELEGGLRGLNEIPLVDAENLVEELQGRDGRFADTHGADFVRLDQRDALGALHGMRQRGRGHPAGRAASNDHVVH